MRCLRNYIKFSGRAARSEFWWFVGIVMVVSYLADHASNMTWDYGFNGLSNALSWVFTALAVLVFLPVLTVTFRRFQDVGLPGWLAPALWLAGFGLQMWAEGRQAIQAITNENPLLTPVEIRIDPLYVLLLVVALIVLLTELIICLWRSQPGANKYGPNPHEVTS